MIDQRPTHELTSFRFTPAYNPSRAEIIYSFFIIRFDHCLAIDALSKNILNIPPVDVMQTAQINFIHTLFLREALMQKRRNMCNIASYTLLDYYFVLIARIFVKYSLKPIQRLHLSWSPRDVKTNDDIDLLRFVLKTFYY